MNQFIAVYNSNGDVISNIKYYDGFMGQRIGAISCLAFHPHWVRPHCTSMQLHAALRVLEKLYPLHLSDDIYSVILARRVNLSVSLDSITN
jgi:hypothetical protein